MSCLFYLVMSDTIDPVIKKIYHNRRIPSFSAMKNRTIEWPTQ